MFRKIIVAAVVGLSCATSSHGAPPYKILISQFVEHPALNATTKGIIEGLSQEGFVAGPNSDIRVESAQANPSLAGQIASKFIAQNPSIVVGVGTISAQSFAKYARQGQTKLVFSTVTNPMAAGLVESLSAPGRNTSGVSNFVAIEPQLDLFKVIQPTLKRLGFLYNPGELNSVSLLKKLQALCPQYGFTLVVQAVTKTADVAQGAVKLSGQCDAIFISNDNTALSGLASIAKACVDAKIPLYVSDTDAVPLGALAALGPNQFDVGVQTGHMIARILKGGDINNEPVLFPGKMALVLNEKVAAKLGIKIPEAVRDRASK